MLRAVNKPMRLILGLCMIVLVVPIAKARLRPQDFDVPDGRIQKARGGRLPVASKVGRATPRVATHQDVTVKFAYLGPTHEVSQLGNGEVWSQFGIKLRAQDTCNIVYVKWH